MAEENKLNFKIIEESKNKLIFEIDSNYGFANLLVDSLWNVKGVEGASFYRPHPELPKIKFVVEGDNPREALKTAINEIKKQNRNFLKEIKELNLGEVESEE